MTPHSYFDVWHKDGLSTLQLKNKTHIFGELVYQIQKDINTVYVYNVRCESKDYCELVLDFFLESFKDYNIIAKYTYHDVLRGRNFVPIVLCDEPFVICYACESI